MIFHISFHIFYFSFYGAASSLQRRCKDFTKLGVLSGDVGDSFLWKNITPFNDPQPDTRLIKFFKYHPQLMHEVSVAFSTPGFSIIWRRGRSRPQYLPGDMFSCGSPW